MDKDFERINNEAASRAARALKSGFDSEAFMVYSIAMMNSNAGGKTVDLIPDSTVDESISYLLKSFVNYHNGDHSNVSEMLSIIRKIISEVYHASESVAERDAISGFIQSIEKFK